MLIIWLTNWTSDRHSPCIARKLRVQYPGAIYHLLNRGDRREAVFLDQSDRELFLECLGEVCLKTGWEFMLIV